MYKRPKQSAKHTVWLWNKMAAGLISGLEIKYSSALLQCGFFKRAAKDQYNAAYHKAEVHVQPSDERSDEAWFISLIGVKSAWSAIIANELSFPTNLLTERRKKSNQTHIVRSWRKSFRVLIWENVSHKVSIKHVFYQLVKKLELVLVTEVLVQYVSEFFQETDAFSCKVFGFYNTVLCSCFSCHLLGCLRNQNLQSMPTLSRASLFDRLEFTNAPRLKRIVFNVFPDPVWILQTLPTGRQRPSLPRREN